MGGVGIGGGINSGSNVVMVQQPMQSQWHQYGMLTSGQTVLPLMGRSVPRNRDKYQYYTISNQHNNIRMPIMVQGKNGLDEYGVKELNTGDSVLVSGIGEVYTVTLYPNGSI